MPQSGHVTHDHVQHPYVHVSIHQCTARVSTTMSSAARSNFCMYMYMAMGFLHMIINSTKKTNHGARNVAPGLFSPVEAATYMKV